MSVCLLVRWIQRVDGSRRCDMEVPRKQEVSSWILQKIFRASQRSFLHFAAPANPSLFKIPRASSPGRTRLGLSWKHLDRRETESARAIFRFFVYGYLLDIKIAANSPFFWHRSGIVLASWHRLWHRLWHRFWHRSGIVLASLHSHQERQQQEGHQRQPKPHQPPIRSRSNE